MAGMKCCQFTETCAETEGEILLCDHSEGNSFSSLSKGAFEKRSRLCETLVTIGTFLGECRLLFTKIEHQDIQLPQLVKPKYHFIYTLVT